MKIVIRADSGTIMGSGHVMRCLVLADELKKGAVISGQWSDIATISSDPSITFACQSLPGNITSVIESRGYKVKIFTASPVCIFDQIIKACHPREGGDPYSRELVFKIKELVCKFFLLLISKLNFTGIWIPAFAGMTSRGKYRLEQANKEFIDFIKQEKPDVLIIDNYDTDIELEKQVRKYVGRIVVIDDLANRKHDADILLDQNPCPDTHSRYKNLLSPSAIKLLGLQYALLAKEFVNYRKNISRPKLIKNILIFFGGGDHKNVTETVINSLILDSNFRDFSFSVVVGNSNPNKEKICALCESQNNFTYRCQINNMAELMSKADLFIGAGGTTSWERMCVGLPGIIISIAENQEESCHELAKLDVIKYLGTAEEFSPEKLLDTLEWIQKNPEWLSNASQLGQGMVDGCGAKRVVGYIKAMSLTFKKANIEDCKNIFVWRNSEESRRYSINSNEISFENHEKWFAKIINDTRSNLLICYHENQALGVVRFDFVEKIAEISLYLTPGRHGQGYGLPLLIASENWLRDNCANINEITAKVLQENIASIKIFQYALYSLGKYDKNILLFNKRLNHNE